MERTVWSDKSKKICNGRRQDSDENEEDISSTATVESTKRKIKSDGDGHSYV